MAKLFFSALFISQILLIQQAYAVEGPASCMEVKISKKKDGKNTVYNIDGNTSVVITYNESLDPLTDYGARLILIKKAGDKFVRQYASSGSGDSYGMRPTFIKNCGGHAYLIFGEIGTEYSWGLRVFTYDGEDVRDLGTIPLAVEGEFDAESVIPYMIIAQEDKSVILSFTKDLIRDPGGSSEKKIPKTKIKFQIKGNKLTEILQ